MFGARLVSAYTEGKSYKEVLFAVKYAELSSYCTPHAGRVHLDDAQSISV